jgi:hypothetical protein
MMNQNPDWSDKTILIVEDDLIARIYLEKTLRDLAQLIFVKNGKDAVETVKADPSVNLVLMDMKMPVKTGFEATAEIKDIRPELPVIAQTALAFPQDKKRAREAGCDDFISKPIEVDILFEKLTRFFGK